LDDLVRSGQQHFWDGKAERFGGLHVNNQLELDRLDDREVSRFFTFENSSDILISP